MIGAHLLDRLNPHVEEFVPEPRGGMVFPALEDTGFRQFAIELVVSKLFPTREDRIGEVFPHHHHERTLGAVPLADELCRNFTVRRL